MPFFIITNILIITITSRAGQAGGGSFKKQGEPENPKDKPDTCKPILNERLMSCVQFVIWVSLVLKYVNSCKPGCKSKDPAAPCTFGHFLLQALSCRTIVMNAKRLPAGNACNKLPGALKRLVERWFVYREIPQVDDINKGNASVLFSLLCLCGPPLPPSFLKVHSFYGLFEEPPWSMHYKMLNICSLQNAFLASSRGHFIEAVWGHFLLQNALLECFFCNHRKAFYRWRRCSLRYLTSQLVSHFVVTCRFRIIIYHNPGRSIL